MQLGTGDEGEHGEWAWRDVRAGATVYEDEAVLVLDKPAGVSVTGERHDTDLVRLAADAGETLYPAHRIDKATSGVVLFAKELRQHGDLTRQFQRRTVSKQYLAVTCRSATAPGAGPGGGPARLPTTGEIALPLSVGRKNRVRVAAPRTAIAYDATRGRWSVPDSDVFTQVRTYPATTGLARLWDDPAHAVVALRPESGRRHQIRVHLAWVGHPIAGDPLFDRRAAARGDRTCLHAYALAFDAAWARGRRITVSAEPGTDFWAPVAGLCDPAVVTAGLG